MPFGPAAAGGGGVAPPTKLTGGLVILGSVANTTITTRVGAQESSSVTSSTLTEVINIAKGGTINLLGLMTSSGTTVTNAKIRIIIDGTEVLNITVASLTQFGYFSIVGSYLEDTGILSFSEGSVPFNNSLVVEVAGDDVSGVQVLHKEFES